MSVLSICILILLGIVLLLTEFLVIPGITVAGIAGTLLLIGGIFCGYFYHPVATGNYIFIGTLVLLAVSFTIALKSKSWQRYGLSAEITGKVGGIDSEKIKTGDTGMSTSKLSPIGKAIFNETTFEVSSEGGYIDQNRELIVTRIEGNKIFVIIKN
jgi:membrane-bound ClpP family serine protease